MALEDDIKALTAAVIENTAVHKANGGKSPAAGAASTTTAKEGAKTTAKKQKNSLEQVKAAVTEVRENIDADAARAIIFKYAGDGAKLAALANFPDKFDAIVADAEAAIAAKAAEGDDGDDEGDI